VRCDHSVPPRRRALPTHEVQPDLSVQYLPRSGSTRAWRTGRHLLSVMGLCSICLPFQREAVAPQTRPCGAPAGTAPRARRRYGAAYTAASTAAGWVPVPGRWLPAMWQAIGAPTIPVAIALSLASWCGRETRRRTRYPLNRVRCHLPDNCRTPARRLDTHPRHGIFASLLVTAAFLCTSPSICN